MVLAPQSVVTAPKNPLMIEGMTCRFSRRYLSFAISVLFVSVPLSSCLTQRTSRRSRLTPRNGHELKTLYSTTNSVLFAENDDNDEIPSMDWLTDSLSTPAGDGDSAIQNTYNDESMSTLNSSPYLEEHSVDGDLGDVPIPTTGLSLSDEMEKVQKERFYSQLVPITGLGKGVKAVRILSSTADGGYEAVRYLVRLTRTPDEINVDLRDFGIDSEDIDEEEQVRSSASSGGGGGDDYVMIDVPPFSETIVEEMKNLMGPSGRLSMILVTSQDCIHYDDSPGVFSVRKADLPKWKKAFPSTAIVAYRMDIPRDCRDSITQRLDGYGPWAMEECRDDTGSFFEESGIPLTVKEWDEDLAQDILTGKQQPSEVEELELDEMSQLDRIRANEEGKRVLAVYTPGRSFGSMTYVFPELQLCASGFSLPLEDSRGEENYGMDSAGPALDHRGYVTTSKAGIARQVESARKLVDSYIDRFEIILTARGDPFYLEDNVDERRQTLLETIGQYEKLGSIYERLGISNNF